MLKHAKLQCCGYHFAQVYVNAFSTFWYLQEMPQYTLILIYFFCANKIGEVSQTSSYSISFHMHYMHYIPASKLSLRTSGLKILKPAPNFLDSNATTFAETKDRSYVHFIPLRKEWPMSLFSSDCFQASH